MDDKWLKQTDGPLFEDMLWLKPENPHQRPRVLIIGGSTSGFMPTTQLYSMIKSKSAYQTRVVMPKSLEKLVGTNLPDALYVPTTTSGEISSEAKNELKAHISWAQVVVVSDDIGNNSQTELMLQELLQSTDTPTFVIGNAVKLIAKNAQAIAGNEHMTLVGALQDIATFVSQTDSTAALLSSDGTMQIVNKSLEIFNTWSLTAVTWHENQIIVISSDRVSTTKSKQISYEDFVALACQFGKNFDSREFEALTTGAYLATL